MAVIRTSTLVGQRLEQDKTQEEAAPDLSILMLGAKYLFNLKNPYFYKGF